MARTERHQTDAPAPVASDTAWLTVYVEEGCRACGHALEVIERVQREFPALRISTVDLGGVSSHEIPNGVFAAPTFVLDGEVISLGTPTWERLAPLLRSALGRAGAETRRAEG